MIKTFNDSMRERFGGKVYRLSLRLGTTCPNRDGFAGSGGCIFCSESGSGDFAAEYSDDIDTQIEKAKQKVSSKLTKDFAGYVAYFQSFTTTYVRNSKEAARLETRLRDALKRPDIIALSLGTRPDCLPDNIIAMLLKLKQEYGKPIWVELGLQTIHDETAAFINRCYKTCVYDDAVARLKKAGLEVITHVIIGLPGETDEMMKQTVEHIAGQHVEGIKLQLLHVLKNTRLAQMLADDEKSVYEYTLEQYTEFISDLLDIIEQNSPETVIHRMTGDPPKSLLISPLWAADKKRVINSLNNMLRQRKN